MVLTWHSRSSVKSIIGTMGKIQHGHAFKGHRSKEYTAWTNMKVRCYRPTFKQFSDYGGRGIIVCHRWRYSFSLFLADMGLCPPNHSLDRIDNNGNYEPSNCKWSTWREQGLNKRARETCKLGHPLDMRQGKWRRCRICWREYHKNWERRRRMIERQQKKQIHGDD